MGKQILIVVEGGLIQDIHGIPPDIVIQVHDYDVDPGDEVEANLQRDRDGDLYFGSEWTSEGSPPLPDG